MRWYSIILLILLVAGTGCTSNDGYGVDEALKVSALTISPQNANLVAGVQASPLEFSASVTWNSGEVTEHAQVAWSSSNQVAGQLDRNGLFTPAAANGGVTLISASYLGFEASTTLTVVYEMDIVEEGLPSTLPEMCDAASQEENPEEAPFIRYPYDGTVVPRNIPQLEIHWDPVEGRPLTVLELTSNTTRTRIFTLEDSWTPDATQWQSIAATNSGGAVLISAWSGVLQGEGESARLEGALVGGGRMVELSISRLDAGGSIYYWSSSNQGIMRIATNATKAVEFFTPATDGDACVSCHSLTYAGTKLAIGYLAGGSNRQGLLLLNEEGPPTELFSKETGIPATYSTTTPGEEYTVGVDAGRLSLYDGQTWAYLGAIAIGYDRVANPKFSPDGEELVFTVVDSADFMGDMHFYFGRIAAASFDVDTGLFGEPYWVTPEVEGANQYYPVYSPDGKWIAFNQSYSGKNGDNADSMMDGTAELFLVPRGGGVPIRLDALNDVDEEYLGEQHMEVDFTPVPGSSPPPGELEPDIANSWPGWAPLPDADMLWLTFSSLRGFGHDVDFGNPQIWVSAIDPEKAAAGLDPSHPPFWLPLQDPLTNNHIPQWGRY